MAVAGNGFGIQHSGVNRLGDIWEPSHSWVPKKVESPPAIDDIRPPTTDVNLNPPCIELGSPT